VHCLDEFRSRGLGSEIADNNRINDSAMQHPGTFPEILDALEFRFFLGKTPFQLGLSACGFASPVQSYSQIHTLFEREIFSESTCYRVITAVPAVVRPNISQNPEHQPAKTYLFFKNHIAEV
jgi:hypothetical protein